MPFGILILGILFSFICKLILWKWLNLLRMITISTITIVFTLYSSTSSIILNLFTCRTIEDDLVLARDVKIKCWEGNHLRWSMGFGLPFLLLWVFGIPVLGIMFLFNRRKHVSDPKFVMYFLLLYQGFKP